MPALETVQAFLKHNAMKPLFAGSLLLCIMSLAAMTLAKCNKDSERPVKHDWPADTANHDEYVNLGLKSRTWWKSANEKNPADPEYGFYTYDEAMEAFGDSLPTIQQFMELKQSCEWEWVSVGFYIVVGPNKNYIILPAAGFRDCSGTLCYERSYGFYWSSTPDGATRAWYMNFYSGDVYMYNYDRCYANSVRLVRNDQNIK